MISNPEVELKSSTLTVRFLHFRRSYFSMIAMEKLIASISHLLRVGIVNEKGIVINHHSVAIIEAVKFNSAAAAIAITIERSVEASNHVLVRDLMYSNYTHWSYFLHYHFTNPHQ